MMSLFANKNNPFERFITQNTEMQSIFQYIESVVKTLSPILITGELGSGKSLLAECVHGASGVKGPLVRVDSVGLDDLQFSDLLFGHVKGAFPGAEHDQPGVIETAVGGMLFINEIGVLSLSSQIKLLRLLQYGEYLPLGETAPRQASIPIVTATSADLWSLQRGGKFRKDLNLKIRTHHVHIPALRERSDDIPVLIDYFMGKASETYDKKKPTPPRELLTLLTTYSFPGNVKELKTMVYDAVKNHRSKVLSLDIFKEHLDRRYVHGAGDPENDLDDLYPFRSFRELPTIRKAAMMLIDEAMRRAGGNQSIAARMLGISQPALSKRLKNETQST